MTSHTLPRDSLSSGWPEVLRIGLATALTGKFSLPGRQALVGVQAWIDDTNRRGGIRLGGRAASLPVRLIYYDDCSDAERCGSAIESLIRRDQVHLLLGPYASGLTRRAVQVAQKYRQVLWNHGGSSDAIYAQGSAWVVGLLTPASQYFTGVLDVIRRQQPSLQRLAVVHTTTGQFAREVAQGAVRHAQQCGMASVRVYPYPADTVDFTPLLRQLIADGSEVLLGVGRIADDIRLAAQIRRAAMPFPAIGLIATPLTMFRHMLGSAADGFLGPSQWEPRTGTAPDYGPAPDEVLRSLQARAPDGVDYPMAQAYAGALMAQYCLEAAGTLAQEALRQAANRLDVTTFYGRFRIDPRTGRQLGHVMPVVQWQQGQKVIVGP